MLLTVQKSLDQLPPSAARDEIAKMDLRLDLAAARQELGDTGRLSVARVNRLVGSVSSRNLFGRKSDIAHIRAAMRGVGA